MGLILEATELELQKDASLGVNILQVDIYSKLIMCHSLV